MEKGLPTQEDYRTYDKIWQRVSPGLNPYPEARSQNESAQAMPAPEAAQESASEQALLLLPGAQADPCCMGSEAAGELGVLRGFLREELAVVRGMRALVRRAPGGSSRNLLRQMAEDDAGHVRQLQAAHFLITGERYRVTVVLAGQKREPWCDALRAQYHQEACAAFNYARASEETEDLCLRRLFSQLSEDEYRHAGALRELLAETLG